MTGHRPGKDPFTWRADDHRSTDEEVRMSSDAQLHLTATKTEVDNAEQQLIAALDAAPDDDMATERITAALNRLRNAQARHTAAASGLPHLPDLVGWG
jgi:hypothetical protein